MYYQEDIMAAIVDVNERTLEKDKIKFVKMCRFFEMLARIFMIIMIVCLPVLLLFYIAASAGLVSGMSEYATPENMYFVASLCGVCIGYITALNFGARIFKTVRTAETPFRYDVADKIKGAGYALAASGALGFVLNMVAVVLKAKSGFAIEAHMPEAAPFLFGVFLIALAYVFDYGCKLQQQADETL